MDYTSLIHEENPAPIKLGLVGATGGFGYTLLAQLPHVRQIALRAVCALDAEECIRDLAEIGYARSKIVFCQDEKAIQDAPNDAVLVLEDYRLVLSAGITALVECTGNAGISAELSAEAIGKGISVYMGSKETDSFCGPYLNRIARRRNAVYALVNGDQPRNLLDLYSWARLLGLEVVAAGKSSEYDFVWDRETGELSYMDGKSAPIQLAQMQACWRFQGRETLRQRQALLKDYTSVIAADLCEMNLVANVTGLLPASPTLSYPIARAGELADIFIPEEDGGILARPGAVDVFFNLRETSEASFCGGEFIIVRCKNERMWQQLAEKGHVVSRNKKYACIYYPYHFMGLETPISILLGERMRVGIHPECRQTAVMAGAAERDLAKGTRLLVQGHHHSIEGITPQLLQTQEHADAVPFYLLHQAVLRRDGKRGEPITWDCAELADSRPLQFYKDGLRLSALPRSADRGEEHGVRLSGR